MHEALRLMAQTDPVFAGPTSSENSNTSLAWAGILKEIPAKPAFHARPMDDPSPGTEK